MLSELTTNKNKYYVPENSTMYCIKTFKSPYIDKLQIEFNKVFTYFELLVCYLRAKFKQRASVAYIVDQYNT